ncbi:hypothetical protein [Puia dinghuensis]|uniref:Uncharacterized protein n=1 Tax=Puia dinghuensis TaxID=1792502 RepID=A0A8J2U7V6_9BACT|nr:hypothetical protein [Puia dinghuensis]GGA84769.1 hypothetical protein GCM10011511_04750 [Puia dinghuensis]
MGNAIIRILLLPVLLFSCAPEAPAQQTPAPGPPNAAQQQALDKVMFAVKTIFNKLNSSDWILRRDYYDPKAIVNYWQAGAPMNLNNNFERVYEIKAGTPSYEKLIRPLVDKDQEFYKTQQYDSARILDAKIKALSHFELYANLNMATVNLQPTNRRQPNVPLSVKGCTYSCLSNHGNVDRVVVGSYHLLFGAWDPAQCAKEQTARYQFRHPVGTPYIENIDIEIIGDNDFIRNWVDTADWSLITQALSN